MPTRVLGVRFTDEEREAVNKAAGGEEKAASWLRALAIDATRPKTEPRSLAKVLTAAVNRPPHPFGGEPNGFTGLRAISKQQQAHPGKKVSA